MLLLLFESRWPIIIVGTSTTIVIGMNCGVVMLLFDRFSVFRMSTETSNGCSFSSRHLDLRILIFFVLIHHVLMEISVSYLSTTSTSCWNYWWWLLLKFLLIACIFIRRSVWSGWLVLIVPLSFILTVSTSHAFTTRLLLLLLLMLHLHDFLFLVTIIIVIIFEKIVGVLEIAWVKYLLLLL